MTISNLTNKIKNRTISSGVTPTDTEFIVTNTNDSGAGSLRQAIIDSNSTSGNNEITFAFASGSAPFTIVLNSALPSIVTTATAGTLTITGPGSSLTISGNNGDSARNFSIFTIDAGGNLTISGVTVSGAKTTGFGGAFNTGAGTLAVSNSTISGNTAFRGGAIFNTGAGTLSVSNSTLSGNSVTNGGGGIFNNGTLTVSNSTFSGNSAAFNGGGIFNNGTLTVSNSTFSGNSAAFNGGGIFNAGTLTVSNSTLSGNSAAFNGGGIRNNGTLNIANTIIANSTSGGDFSGFGTVNLISGATAANNLVTQAGLSAWATTVTTGDLNLGTLQNNGGPTFTMALGAGSSAIGTGSATISNAAPISGLDQRGYTRSATTPSIGAFE